MHYILNYRDETVNISFKCKGKTNILVERHSEGCHRSKMPAIYLGIQEFQPVQNLPSLHVYTEHCIIILFSAIIV